MGPPEKSMHFLRGGYEISGRDRVLAPGGPCVRGPGWLALALPLDAVAGARYPLPRKAHPRPRLSQREAI
jgi:hypothetical protein